MKKILLTVFSVIAFAGYNALGKTGVTSNEAATGQDQVAVRSPIAANSSPTSDTVPGSNNPPNPSKTPAPSTAIMGQYKDGTYVGSVADAFYGNVQVQATVVNGRLVNVGILQYPNDRSNSIRINSMAMPALQQEAVKAQTAQVDIISGATDSSQAFIESLQSALQKAK